MNFKNVKNAKSRRNKNVNKNLIKTLTSISYLRPVLFHLSVTLLRLGTERIHCQTYLS